jgi:hypothetical protein
MNKEYFDWGYPLGKGCIRQYKNGDWVATSFDCFDPDERGSIAFHIIGSDKDEVWYKFEFHLNRYLEIDGDWIYHWNKIEKYEKNLWDFKNKKE